MGFSLSLQPCGCVIPVNLTSDTKACAGEAAASLMQPAH